MAQGEIIARIRYQLKSGYCDISQTMIKKALTQYAGAFTQLDVKLVTDAGILVRDRTLEMLEFSIKELREEIKRGRATGNVQKV